MQFIALRWLSFCIEKSRYVEPGIDYILHNDIRSPKKHSREQKSSTGVHVNDSTPLLDNVQNNNKPIQSRFACAHSSENPRNVLNLNMTITDELSKLAAAYKNSNDQWRCFGYEKAIAAIKRHPKIITSREGKTKETMM